MGDTLFAVPRSALTETAQEHGLALDVGQAHLKNAPGLDKNLWPNFADPTFQRTVSAHQDAGR